MVRGQVPRTDRYRLLARRLETTEGMIAVRIRRLRQRYRCRIEEKIAQTVADPGGITTVGSPATAIRSTAI